MLQNVTIVFKNGVVQSFLATDFNADLSNTENANRPYKYTYKYEYGDIEQELPLYLSLNEVAAIMVNPV